MPSRALPRSFYLVLFFLLIAGNIGIYQTIFAPRVLTITVLEVGKGNAVLIHAPTGKLLLLDTGPDASTLRALGNALPPWERTIDAVILTGTKSALVGGLPAVESRYRISKLIRIGNSAIPYGTFFTFDGSRIEIISPGAFSISYGSSIFKISSSTPKGIYISDGQTFMKN